MENLSLKKKLYNYKVAVRNIYSICLRDWLFLIISVLSLSGSWCKVQRAGEQCTSVQCNLRAELKLHMPGYMVPSADWEWLCPASLWSTLNSEDVCGNICEEINLGRRLWGLDRVWKMCCVLPIFPRLEAVGGLGPVPHSVSHAEFSAVHKLTVYEWELLSSRLSLEGNLRKAGRIH